MSIKELNNESKGTMNKRNKMANHLILLWIVQEQEMNRLGNAQKYSESLFIFSRLDYYLLKIRGEQK